MRAQIVIDGLTFDASDETPEFAFADSVPSGTAEVMPVTAEGLKAAAGAVASLARDLAAHVHDKAGADEVTVTFSLRAVADRGEHRFIVERRPGQGHVEVSFTWRGGTKEFAESEGRSV